MIVGDIMIKLKLNELLELNNISQRELSRITGIRQATISDYVNNKQQFVKLSHLDSFCTVFNCDVNDIIKFTPPNSEGQRELFLLGQRYSNMFSKDKD